MAAEYTKFLLRKTQSNSSILNSDYIDTSNSYFGLGKLTSCEPWVQTKNKQLWIDGVCINPTIFAKTTSTNARTFLYAEESWDLLGENKRVLNITLDFNAMLNEISSQSISFQIQNIGDQTAKTVYNPFNDSFYNKLWMYEHINIHTVSGTTQGFGITSEYIDSAYLATGTAVISEVGGNAKTDGLENVIAANMYLVIKSNFNNYNIVDVTSLTGGGGSSTTQTLTPSVSSNNMVVTLSDGGGSFTLAGPKHDSINDTGNDVRFSITSNTVEMHVNVIDGGIIEDPSNNGGEPISEPGQQ